MWMDITTVVLPWKITDRRAMSAHIVYKALTMLDNIAVPQWTTIPFAAVVGKKDAKLTYKLNPKDYAPKCAVKIVEGTFTVNNVTEII